MVAHDGKGDSAHTLPPLVLITRAPGCDVPVCRNELVNFICDAIEHLEREQYISRVYAGRQVEEPQQQQQEEEEPPPPEQEPDE